MKHIRIMCCLIGFNEKNTAHFYDIPAKDIQPESNHKHVLQTQIDKQFTK